MIGTLRAMAIALVIAGGLAGPAAAQTPEAQALGVRIARIMFTSMQFDRVMSDAATAGMGRFNLVKSRPEWAELLAQSMRDEITNDMPAFERIFGQGIARGMSVEELKAGVILLEDPAIQAAMRNGGKSAGPPPEPGPAAAAVVVSPEGKAFLKRLENLGQIFEPLKDEFMIELMPGTFRRFGEKAEAMEAARRR